MAGRLARMATALLISGRIEVKQPPIAFRNAGFDAFCCVETSSLAPQRAPRRDFPMPVAVRPHCGWRWQGLAEPPPGNCDTAPRLRRSRRALDRYGVFRGKHRPGAAGCGRGAKGFRGRAGSQLTPHSWHEQRPDCLACARLLQGRAERGRVARRELRREDGRRR